MINYYRDIDKKYHDEVYELIQVLEVDFVDTETEEQQTKAMERLEELKNLA